ncbi:MAG: glycosyltransferase family 2 protein [Gemmatimonadaceae bacterium]
MTRVSVIIPTYNRAQLLKLTLQSILAQTHPVLEIIVVDDGSADNTSEICAEFGAPVRYIHQRNQGVSAARNNALRAAEGDWIAFCDSDDLWMPNKLQLQLEAIEATGADFSVTDFTLIDPDGQSVPGGERGFTLSFPVFGETGVNPEQHLGKWLARRELRLGSESIATYTGDSFGMLFLGNVIMPSTAIVARDVITRAGSFDETFHVAEDTEYFHRVSAHSTLTILMKPLSQHRIGHPSLVAEKSDKLIENAMRSAVRAAGLRSTLTTRERAALHKGTRMLQVRMAYARLAALDPRAARRALRVGPFNYVLSRRSIAILLVSLLPSSALRLLHRAKRILRGLRS